VRLKDIVESIQRRRTPIYPSFHIDNSRVLGEPTEAVRLVANRSYFEIRLSQMRLRDQREYFFEWIPLTSVMTEFLTTSGPHVIPFVIGPGMLKRAELVRDGDRIDFLNTRVAGPQPYVGGDIGLYVGLFRCQTTDWAKRALTLLEVVAKAVDPTRLSGLVNVAGPVVDGLEQFLGIDALEPRIGLQRAFVAPHGDGSQDASSTVFRTGFDVALNLPGTALSDGERNSFWVRDGRLHYGKDQANLVEYGEADFVLLRTEVLATRSDYATFEFETGSWTKVREHLRDGNEGAARGAMKFLASSVLGCEDLIPEQRVSIIGMYKTRFDEALEIFRSLSQPGRAGFEGRALPGPVSESDLRTAAAQPGPALLAGAPLETVMERLGI
jgi:hypothetical protein